ncbi:MAG: G5 domain-containing protein [Anaerolineales bacterium]|jgi:uncharacterized protein YabE (DUF348 family)/3D (Asp-Asp-Asp) domain-containing protein
MRPIFWLVILGLSLISCQPQATYPVTIIDGEQIHTLTTDKRIPVEMLTEARIALAPEDLLLVNGHPFSPEQSLPPQTHSIQIRRAANVNLVTPEGEQELSTTAETVGASLHEAGVQLYAADFIDPPIDTPIIAGMTITYRQSQELMVSTNAGEVRIRSSARTIGVALAGAGIPLEGLDYSLPAESDALPADGKVRVVRVSESIQLIQKSIPFETETASSPDVALGTQEIVQPGQEGLAVARTRIRYEDGQEVNREIEGESVVRPPQTRIVNTGTKIVVTTATVGGETLDYWLAYEMYATIYSPCNSGTGGCSYSTASGLRAGRGVVAMDRSMYSYLQGARIYIPGYGYAVVGDVGGGSIVEENIGVSRYRWIDLGFNDNNILDMSGWLTVYFLSPVPASIPPVMQ